MNFFSDEMRNKYNFQNNAFANNTTQKKQYRCTCPLFSGIKKCFTERSCNCNCNNCNIFSCSCCKNINIRAFAKNRPYCFAGIISGIFFIILILIIIIAVSVNKNKKKEETEVNTKFLDFTKIDYLQSKYSSLSAEEKVKLVYRWITKNIKYDKDGDVERDPEKFF